MSVSTQSYEAEGGDAEKVEADESDEEGGDEEESNELLYHKPPN